MGRGPNSCRNIIYIFHIYFIEFPCGETVLSVPINIILTYLELATRSMSKFQGYFFFCFNKIFNYKSKAKNKILQINECKK